MVNCARGLEAFNETVECLATGNISLILWKEFQSESSPDDTQALHLATFEDRLACSWVNGEVCRWYQTGFDKAGGIAD